MKNKLKNLLRNSGLMYEYEAKGYYQQKGPMTYAGIALIMVKGLIRKIIRRLLGAIELDTLEFYITTRCTLRCRDCLVLIPYQQQQHFDLDALIQDMQQLLKLVDRVYQLGLLGGDPLLHPKLPQIIRWLEKHPKVKRIGITVNGDSLPDYDTLQALKQSKKAMVYISDYPDSIAQRKKELLELLEKQQVKHRILSAPKWMDFGDYRLNLNKSKQVLRNQFSRCFANHFYGVVNGRLYHCGRSAMVFRAAELPEPPGNSYDFKKQTSITSERAELKRFLRKNFIPGCNYCNDNEPERLIAPAIQRKQIR